MLGRFSRVGLVPKHKAYRSRSPWHALGAVVYLRLTRRLRRKEVQRQVLEVDQLLNTLQKEVGRC